MEARIFYLLMLRKYINSKQKKPGLIGWLYNFFVHYRPFDTSNFINIQKYLMKKHDVK